MFRRGLDPIELHWQISALCFFNVSNRATFSKIFGRDFGAAERSRAFARNAVEMMLRFVARQRRRLPRVTGRIAAESAAAVLLMYELVRIIELSRRRRR